MGRDCCFACQDCEVDIILGYGSYGGWIPPNSDIKTAADYDAFPDPSGHKSYHRNLMFRKAMVEHKGHTWLTYSTDWCFINKDTQALEMDKGWYGSKVLMENVGRFRRENWSI